MSRRKNSGWSMPLMEMIAAVCFFILCASVCIQIFVKAENLSRLADDTNYSILMSQSIAEAIKSDGEAGLTEKMGAEVVKTGHYRMTCESGDGQAYEADIMTSEVDSMLTANISISKKRQVLYELCVSRYRGIPAEGSL